MRLNGLLFEQSLLAWDHKKKILIVSITNTNNNHLIAVCSKDGIINFYKAVGCPNLYPYWTHLYYGKLTLDKGTVIKSCELSKDYFSLFVFQSNPLKNKNFKLKIYNLYRIINVNNRKNYFNDYPDINSKISKLGFEIVLPLDNFNIIWSTSKKISKYNIDVKDSNFLKRKEKFDAKLITNSLLNVAKKEKKIENEKKGKQLTTSQVYFKELSSNYLLISNGDKINLIHNNSIIDPSRNEIIDINFYDHLGKLLILEPNNTLSFYHKRANSNKNGAIWKSNKINLQNIQHPSKKQIQKIFVYELEKCNSPRKELKERIVLLNTKRNSESLIIGKIILQKNKRFNRSEQTKFQTIQEIPISKILHNHFYHSNNNNNNNNNNDDDDNNSNNNIDHKDLLFKISPDGKYLAITFINSTTIKLFKYDRNSKNYIKNEILDLNFNNNEKNDKVISINFYQYQYYYLQIGTSNGNYYIMKTNNEESSECYQYARLIISPAKIRSIQPKRKHLYQHGNQRSNYIIDGIWKHPLFLLSILIFLILYYFLIIVDRFENYFVNKIRNIKYYPKMSSLIHKFLYYLPFYLTIFSIYEIITQQTTFVNDWPAHMSHIQQFLKEKTLDYSHYMHHHGPNTYPAGWQYLYSVFYFITNFGSITLFQILFAVFELLLMILIFRTISLKHLKLPLAIAILAIFSNRLHLYNIRVLTNDFPSTFGLYIVFCLFLNKKWIWASIAYSFVVATKLNFIFYSPVIFLILLHSVGFMKTILLCLVMLSEQILLALPFILVNPIGYLQNAYDVNRILFWEKSRNFKFVGLEIFDDSRWHVLLLCLILIILVMFLKKINILLQKIQVGSDYWKRLIIFSLMFSNFIFITFSRGLHTPFFVWYFYSFSTICYFSGIPNLFIITFCITHEVFFRFWHSHILEMWITLVYFLINLFVIISTFNNEKSLLNIINNLKSKDEMKKKNI
ncbi:hypothetical protein M0813_15294 [Anaeramoeba flamelloides]|uniref:Dolichyl-phosphate-mannose--protein mannosyltransferase n=1 Tax=Anaeramoeba flamelloides TaxID=1746091 RepID=A0ABQ8Z2U9_9EUKA|nr:hypothetical protein M0813_15294 [Anaeramoeba flamelloides]